MLVAGSGVRVGDGIRTGEMGVCVEFNGSVGLVKTGGGVLTKPRWVLVGVGVGKKTPVTTKLAPSRRPSSLTIVLNAAGFMGASIS